MTLFASLLLGAALAPSALHTYDVTVDTALTRFDVRACFADGMPPRLFAGHPAALKATREFHFLLDGKRVTRTPQRHVLELPQPSDDGCIEWQVSLDVIAEQRRLNVGYRTKNSLLLAPATWAWQPAQLTTNRNILYRFHLDDALEMSVPWQPVSQSPGMRTFLRDQSPLDWPALMAIGQFETAEIEVAGATLRLAIADGPARTRRARVMRWLVPAAEAVTQLWGDFPVPSVQLLVIPVAEGYDAAPWAQSNRGGGPATHLFMNARADEETLRSDWIATHELAHFALPFVARSDAWLSEGFSSYYQAVLRARNGQLTPHAAWQELLDGFERGNRDTEYDTLRDDTLYMHARGRNMRVYWSGAAIAMLADIELRRQSNNAWSLDRVLQEFSKCCRVPERTWQARELFQAFDEIADVDIFDTLYVEHVYSRHFPRLTESLAALGVRETREGIVLEAEAPLASVRDAIMQSRAQ